MATGQAKEAEAVLKSALAADPSYAPAIRSLGLLYERKGDKATAVKLLRKYLRLAPWAPDAKSVKKRIASLGG